MHVLFSSRGSCSSRYIWRAVVHRHKKVLDRAGQSELAGAKNEVSDFAVRHAVFISDAGHHNGRHLSVNLCARIPVTLSEGGCMCLAEACKVMCRLDLKILYYTMGGFYTYSIFALVFWETRRRDFGVSMSHHVTSSLLIFISFLWRWEPVDSLPFFHAHCSTSRGYGSSYEMTQLNMVWSILVLLKFAGVWIIHELVLIPFAACLLDSGE